MMVLSEVGIRAFVEPLDRLPKSPISEVTFDLCSQTWVGWSWLVYLFIQAGLYELLSGPNEIVTKIGIVETEMKMQGLMS